MFNKVILIGRLGRDPELKTAQSGKSYCNFTLATSSGFGDSRQTEWHNVTAFNKTAENVKQYLHKGSLAAVEGRIQYQTYEKDGQKHTTTKIVADSVTFVGSKDEQQTSSNSTSTNHQTANQDSFYKPPESDDTFEGIPNDEIPF